MVPSTKKNASAKRLCLAQSQDNFTVVIYFADVYGLHSVTDVNRLQTREGIMPVEAARQAILDDDLPRARQTAQPVGDIHHVADHGVIHAVFRAHFSHHREAVVDANADPQRQLAGSVALFIQAANRTLDFHRRAHRVFDAVRTLEQRHDLIAHEFIHHPAVGFDDLRLHVEIYVDELDDLLRFGEFGV